MSTYLWGKEDIAHVLAGIASGAPYMGVELPVAEAEAFRTGYVAALSAVAISLGIGPEHAPAPQVRMVAESHSRNIMVLR